MIILRLIPYILYSLFSMPQVTARTFDDEDFEDIQLLLKENVFDWKDLLSKEEYEVASMKKYFSEIAKNNVWLEYIMKF